MYYVFGEGPSRFPGSAIANAKSQRRAIHDNYNLVASRGIYER